MIFINPWWTHHCAGNLEPENDPYGDKYEYPFSGLNLKWWQYILIPLTVVSHTGWFIVGMFYLMKLVLIGTWGIVLFFILFLILLLVYIMANIVTIRFILKF